VLHADDLGMNRAVNEGILRGFRQGLLTSTSLLANAPDVVWALEQWKLLSEEHAAGQLPSANARRKLDDPVRPLDLGVHLNLTQGRPLTGDRYPIELLDAEGRFPGVFSLFVRLRRWGEKFREAIRAELERQVQVIADHGRQPTHLNGHQYIEMMPAISAILPDVMERFGINAVRVACEPSLFRTTALHGFRVWRWPLAKVKHRFARRFRAMINGRGIAHPDAFYGTAHAGSVDLALLRLFLASGRKHPLVEIALHPGEAAEEVPLDQKVDGWHDPLAAFRPGELQMLVSDELATLLERSGRRLSRLAM
jgi:predicted glycoside hydrolase/deacetylase ChbG (UPF0249 family)